LSYPIVTTLTHRLESFIEELTRAHPRPRRLRTTGVADDLVGGRYRLLEVIGVGGMGRVWRAQDELLHRVVAAKEIDPPHEVAASEMVKLQLNTMREARAAARLDHPGIVQVYDVIWRPDRSWIVMEYVPSRSLHEAIRDAGPFRHSDAARIGLGILSALRAAHAAGVLHRDVKPHNVLLAENGRIVLTDFGLASIEGVHGGPDPLLGSPLYIAPERLRGAAAGTPADLWSLGATLYAAVEGRAPFQRATTIGSLTALMTAPPDPPARRGPLSPVIDGMLVKDPDRRLTADQAEPLLRTVADGAVRIVPNPRYGPARPRSRMARSTRITLVTAAVLLVGSVGSALAVDRGAAGAPVTATVAGPSPIVAATAGCEDAGAAAGSAVTTSTAKQRYGLPPGWLWYGDRTGLAVAVPGGWVRTVEGSRTCFRDLTGGRLLSVDTSAALAGAPVAYWEQAEPAELGRDSLSGFRAIGMSRLRLKQGGTDWEYTWQPATGPRLHERRVWLWMGEGRAYAVTWSTRDQDWSNNEPIWQLILASLA
jgi:eukaryotic-like serine/threonine-protein kinase